MVAFAQSLLKCLSCFWCHSPANLTLGKPQLPTCPGRESSVGKQLHSVMGCFNFCFAPAALSGCNKSPHGLQSLTHLLSHHLQRKCAKSCFYVLLPEFFLKQIRYVIYLLSNIKSLLTVGKINPEVCKSICNQSQTIINIKFSISWYNLKTS